MLDGDAKLYVFLTVVFLQNAWLQFDAFVVIKYSYLFNLHYDILIYIY